MMPAIDCIRMEARSERLDRLQCSWHVRYQFCDLFAQITLYAESEPAARSKAVD
jgi:hypothetical protein